MRGHMARRRTERFFQGDTRLLRSNISDSEFMLSTSWPAALPLHRQKEQPPRAPIRRPCLASWQVSPFTLARKTEDLSRSSSITTMGEDSEPLVFSLDDEPFGPVPTLDDGFRLDAVGALGEGFTLAAVATEEEVLQKSSYEFDLADLHDLEQEVSDGNGAVPSQALDRVNSESRSHILGPMLLSALAQVAQLRSHRSASADEICCESGHQDLAPSPTNGSNFLSSSWPVVTVSLRRQLHPPRAPLLRPTAAPIEVVPLEHLMSPAKLSPMSTLRLDHSCRDVVSESMDEPDEECLIFAIDNVQDNVMHEECDDDDDSEDTYLHLAGYVDNDASDFDAESIDNAYSFHEAASYGTTVASPPGASPALRSVLEQVAAERQIRANGPP